MKQLLATATFLLASATLAFSQANPPIPVGPWTDYYNGKNFDGWVYDATPPVPWTITNGILSAKGKGGTEKTMLIWKEPMKDYEVEVVYKLSSQGANGGIQVRSQCLNPNDKFPNCGQYQVCGVQLDVAMDYSGKLFEECLGFFTPKVDHIADCRRTLTLGAWTTTTARINGANISLWLNNVHCLDHVFTKVENLNGIIFALQSHPPYDLIEYKSVKVRKLNVPDVLGCTNKNASNYNPAATKDDGSCKPVVGLSKAERIRKRAVSVTSSVVRYDIPETGNYTVRLLDAFGVVAKEFEGTGPVADAKINLPSLGIFFLEVNSHGLHSMHKVFNF